MMVQRQLVAREQSSRCKLVSSLAARCDPLFECEALRRRRWRVGWHCRRGHGCRGFHGGHLRGHWRTSSIAHKRMVWCWHLRCRLWRSVHGRGHVLRWCITLRWHLWGTRQTTVTGWRWRRQCCTGRQLGRWCSAKHCESVDAASDFFAVCDEFHSFMIEIHAGDIAASVWRAVASHAHKITALYRSRIVDICAIHDDLWRERR